MRAGAGPLPALTRRQVAARVDLPVRRVSQLERRGLRRLRAFGSEGGCGAAGGGSESLESYAATNTSFPAGTVGAGSLQAAKGAAHRRGEVQDEAGSGVKAAFERSEPDPPAGFLPSVLGASAPDKTPVLALLSVGLTLFGAVRLRAPPRAEAAQSPDLSVGPAATS